jgi:hypothetical protein
MYNTKQIFQSKDEILKIANEMTANDFLLEFDQSVSVDTMDNLLDANEGMVNLEIQVKDGEKIESIFILFIDGKFDTYSY